MIPENSLLDITHCRLCPRNCGINRKERAGFCGEKAAIRCARAALHHWEEPCISGTRGSGTVFFSGCCLKCCFCQNYQISQEGLGKELSPERLAQIFLSLQEQGAHNINLVTGTHFLPGILAALDLARPKLSIPVVYNCGGYEKPEVIQLLDGYVDIYLPDLKYYSSTIAQKYSFAGDYFSVASRALQEMYRQVGDPVFDANGIMQKGMIVRHLVLPGCTNDSKAVIQYLYQTFHDHIYISIMNQYTPMPTVQGQYPELNRKVTEEEYDEVVDYAIELGVEHGFIQEGETADESFIPAFDYEGI